MNPLDHYFLSKRCPVLSTRGMVACTQPLASEIGLRILQQGGTAADAAVGMAAAMNVTEPCSTGIGGDAFALYYEAKAKKVHCLMGNGRSPRNLTLKSVRDRGILGSEMPTDHALTVMVPGSAGLWEDLIKRWGEFGLEKVLEPAISLAENGFPVTPVTAEMWRSQESLLKGPGFAAFLNKHGRAPRAGEVMTNEDLGRTFREIAAHGADKGFYSGRIASALVSAISDLGGVLNQDDLSAHKTEKVDPICTQYKGIGIWEVPPPTQGIVALMGLNYLENVKDFSSMEWGSGQHLHYMIESIRLAFSDALEYNGDLALPPHLVYSLLDKPNSIHRSQQCGFGEQASILRAKPMIKGISRSVVGGNDTVYFSVVDREGNGCSFIMSNYMGFGTGIVPEGCGFSLQNRGHNFILDESHPNCLGPYKRSYHTLIPGISTHPNGDLHSVFGVMGGFMQPQGHLQVISNMLDFKMDPQSALDAPRFCVADVDSSLGPRCVEESRVILEKGFAAPAIEDLRKRGHQVAVDSHSPISGFGKGQVILKDKSGVLWGGTDTRADGLALGY